MKKVLLWLGAIVLALLAVVVLAQTYYALTPVPLSTQAQALNARAAKLPTVTENGYRQYGLLAPKALDPVEYGRCLVEAYRASAVFSSVESQPEIGDKAALEARLDARSARAAKLQSACLKGGSPLKLLALPDDLRIRLGMPDEHWERIASARPDETIVNRAQSVWSGGPRRTGAEPDALVDHLGTLVAVQQFTTATAMVFWRNGDRSRAVATWNRSVLDWTGPGNVTLIDVIVSSAAVSQIAFAVQTAAAQADRLDDETARALAAIFDSTAALPQVLSDAMLAEWQTRLVTIRQAVNASDSEAHFAVQRSWANRVLDRLFRLSHDENDTINRLAEADEWAQSAMLRTAMGGDAGDYEPSTESFGCPTLGAVASVCLPFLRNPMGRVLAAIMTPAYPTYGTRVADLRNLVAATRLTIEARRRGLSDQSLAAFVANAPTDMRDVFTGKPFEYDLAKRELRPVLRARNATLGDKGAYALRL